ncbi:crossover junction endodeoxyribonuclease RuvC [Paenibacillus odorifer]|uniref:Uncharacterized protein n=1 Tax=Paenibacillus odorifer TaxID=189426 RepID=A0A1R0XRF8_9BACL|nr:crossover junction endodeoxyribonuclease RuvC [Paenibacillus odorifer]OMD37527.1 hypothetical protein BSK52_21265 [Paenibacillus odorifer]
MYLFCDQSIDRFGYCIAENTNNEFQIHQYGVIKLDTRLDYFIRILSLQKMLNKLHDEWGIQAIVTEQIFHGVSSSTFMKLASLQFFIRHYCYNNCVSFELPLYVSTYRNKWAKSYYHLPEADKQAVYEWMKQWLNEGSDFTHDMSDAILMACFYGIQLQGLEKVGFVNSKLVNYDMRSI